MLCGGKVKLTGLLRRLKGSREIFANEVVQCESLSMQVAANWIASQSATLPQASLFNISVRKYLRHTRCRPAAHTGVFRHLSLHRGRRYAAARTAHCLQSEFGKLRSRTLQYAASSLRGTTSSLIAFENQRCVSDLLFGIQVKVWRCGTYLFLFEWNKVSRSKLCELCVYKALWESLKSLFGAAATAVLTKGQSRRETWQRCPVTK